MSTLVHTSPSLYAWITMFQVLVLVKNHESNFYLLSVLHEFQNLGFNIPEKSSSEEGRLLCNTILKGRK